MKAATFFIETNCLKTFKDVSYGKISQAINRQWLVHRLQTLSDLRDKAVDKDVACKKFLLTSSGPAGSKLQAEHNEIADEFNALRFWWQPPIKHI